MQFSRSLIFGALISAVVLAGALLSFLWTPYDITVFDVPNKLKPPSSVHWLGVDHFGRDILSMIMMGARTSIAVALLAVGVGVIVGVPLGLCAAARKGGLIDEIIMRGNDLVFAFPSLVIAILITAVFGPGAVNAIIAIGIFNIPVFARLARGAALTLWSREFVMAARVAGKSSFRISWEHILPNIMNLMIVQGTIQFSLGILAEAALSYIGLGAQPPTASWGRMLADAQTLVKSGGGTTPELRRQLAAAAFSHTADYDAAIAKYLLAQTEDAGDFSSTLRLTLRQSLPLRYGENPHQCAALYTLADAGPHSVVNAEQLNGKELSYNNLLDLDGALGVARSLPTPGVAVLKHNNPCGAASGATLGEAMEKAWAGDPISAFGSILGFNVPVDAAAAECLAEPGKFVEAIIAPDYTPEAIEILTTKPKWKSNVRLMKLGEIEPGTGGLQLRAIDGGYLAQTADDLPDDQSEWKVVTDAQPTDAQLADLRFAWAVCRHVKSNAIVLAKDQMLLGAGAGQMSRVDSVEISISKAGDRVAGSVLASDAFFPFDDSIHRAAEAGIVALIQPGGSRNDEQVIAACNQHSLPMIFTGCRHFRH